MDSLKAQTHGSYQGQRCLSRADRPLLPTHSPLVGFMQVPVWINSLSFHLGFPKTSQRCDNPSFILWQAIIFCHQILDKNLRYLINKSMESQLSPKATAVCQMAVVPQLQSFSSVFWGSAASCSCHWMSYLNHIRIFLFIGIYKERS